MDDSRIQEDLYRAERAKLILEDPLTVAALADMKSAIVAQWEASPARDFEGREALYRYLKTINLFESHFRTHLANGEIAAFQIRDEERRQNWLAKMRAKLPI